MLLPHALFDLIKERDEMTSRVKHLIAAESFPPYTLSILTVADGHNEMTWDPDDAGSVAVAERKFDEAIIDGGAGVSVGSDGQGSEAIGDFDPNADAIVVHPQIQGG